MTCKRSVKAVGAVLLAVVVNGCAGNQPSFPLPDEPGLYAVVADDDLLRLDGDREWEVESWPERAALRPHTDFVVFDPDLQRYGARGDAVELWRVAWVRSEIDSRGLAGPAQGSEWAVAPIEPFRVPVSLGSAPGYPEYIHVVPRQPLEPGLYSLRLNRLGGGRAGRLGVAWAAVDKREYSAVNCVDRYLNEDPAYRTCVTGSGVTASNATEGLEITLVDPLRRDDSLLVQGIVVNTTDSVKRVPTMRAVLFDKSGQPLTQTSIEPNKRELRAGERMSFKTEVRNAPRTTARIDVDFEPMTNAAM